MNRTPRCELDHVFICADAGAPEANLLVEFGLTEGTPNTHPGQGTANRRFFFRNAMLELLFVTDAAEAATESVRRTGLLQRWQQRRAAASPFGFCFRPATGTPPEPPFSAWAYHQPFFPEPIYIATNSLRVTEPLLFYTPFGGTHWARAQPQTHAAGFEQVTALRLGGPALAAPSAELEAAARTGLLVLTAAEAPVLEIGFDGEATGASASFAPALPLKLYW